jgi:hypothetical protein
MSKVIVVVSVATPLVGSRYEMDLDFDADEWNEMSEAEREKTCREAMFDMIEWNWEVKE